MFGKNKKLKQEKSDGLNLKIKEIFGTIQGEGPYAGQPAIFIRLSGCNLACFFCDTDFEDYALTPINSIIAIIRKEWSIWLKSQGIEENLSCPKLIVITGGEPFRQNIGPLCDLLIQHGHKIQIESNGTIYYQIPHGVEVVCSPKINSGKYWPINQKLLPHLVAIKILVSSHGIYGKGQNLFEAVKIYREQVPGCPIYFQPIDEQDAMKNAHNIKATMEIATICEGILSLQMHKILNIS